MHLILQIWIPCEISSLFFTIVIQPCWWEGDDRKGCYNDRSDRLDYELIWKLSHELMMTPNLTFQWKVRDGQLSFKCNLLPHVCFYRIHIISLSLIHSLILSVKAEQEFDKHPNPTCRNSTKDFTESYWL